MRTPSRPARRSSLAPRFAAFALRSGASSCLFALAASGCAGDAAQAVDLAAPPDLGGSAPTDAFVIGASSGGADLATDPSGPPYPIVLVHGMAGFRNIGPIEYFYGVPEALRKDGHDVWVSRQDPINDSETRGQQVLAYVQTVLAMTGKAKVNLVGHSQGGFDVRYVASLMGDHVASVVTIAAPMGGDPIADVALSAGPGANDAIGFLLDLYGAVNGFDSDAKAQIAQLTAAGAAAFFQKHPDDPRVAYFSIAGRSEMAPFDAAECVSPTVTELCARWNDDNDPLDPLFALPAQLLDAMKPRPTHDGLVPVSSARHGTFLGCIPADHMDEVNQLLGDSPGLGNSFDAIGFYRDLASWLVSQGY